MEETYVTDALDEDCVDPNTYKKAQGKPVRLRGMLANWKLNIEVLKAGDLLNNH